MSEKPMKILVIKHGSLGDIFLMLGALRDLAESAGAKVDVLTMSPYVKLFKRSPDVADVHTDNRRSRFNFKYLSELWGIFHGSEYDLVVDFQNSSRTVFYRRLLGRHLNWCQLGTVAPEDFKSDKTCSPVVAKFAAQLTKWNFPTDGLFEGDLSWLCDESEAQEKVAKSDKSVVLLPGASARHSHKIWPHYASLAEKLLERDFDVYVIPGPDDMELCRSLPGEVLLEEDRWLDFFKLAGVLSKAKFVVGNDSGPTHLAASLNCNGLALFSDRTARYAPNMQRRRMGVQIAPDLADIRVEDVLSKITSVI